MRLLLYSGNRCPAGSEWAYGHETELQDSYVGKVIINCNVCHSHIFENKDDINIEDDGAVNVETQCPYCGESEGFTIIGEIAPFANDSHSENKEENTVDEPSVETEASETEEIEEDLGLGAGIALGDAAIEAGDENTSVKSSRATKRAAAIQEDFKEVSIKTEDQKLERTSDENGKVTFTTEPVEDNNVEETVVPVSSETQEQILDNNIDAVDDIETENVSETDQSAEFEAEPFEVDFDEVDEENIDKLGESYLRKVYDNVESFKTTSVSANEQNMIIEGIIKFASGTEKKTGFLFEAQDVNSRGQLRFSGSNKHFAESKNAFSLVGRIDNKKLFVESLKYNYKVNEETVRGIVRIK